MRTTLRLTVGLTMLLPLALLSQPILQSTPFTRDFLRSPDAATAQTKLGVSGGGGGGGSAPTGTVVNTVTAAAGVPLVIRGADSTNAVPGYAGEPVVAKSAAYTVLYTDNSTFFIWNSATNCTVTFNDGATNGFNVTFKNLGAGSVILTNAAGKTFDGASSLTLPNKTINHIIADGTNYRGGRGTTANLIGPNQIVASPADGSTGVQVPRAMVLADLPSGVVTNTSSPTLGLVTVTSPLVVPSYTAATLPSSTVGSQAWCSDCISPWAIGTDVFYDGATWRGIASKIQATANIQQFLYNAYAGSQWTGSSPRLYASLLDDGFFPATGVGPWTWAGANSGTMSVTSASEINYFKVSAVTSASSSCYVKGWDTTVTAGDYYFMGASVDIEVLPDGTDNYYVIVGLTANGGSGAVAVDNNTCVFVYDPYKGSAVGAQITATNNWQCVTGKAGTWTVNDSGVTATAGVLTSFHQFAISCNAATNAIFWIDGNSVSTNSSNLSTTSVLDPILGIKKTLGTTTRSLDLDWIYFSKWMGTSRNFR